MKKILFMSILLLVSCNNEGGLPGSIVSEGVGEISKNVTNTLNKAGDDITNEGQRLSAKVGNPTEGIKKKWGRPLDRWGRPMDSVLAEGQRLSERVGSPIDQLKGRNGKDGQTVVGPQGEKGDTVVGPKGDAGKDGKDAKPCTAVRVFGGVEVLCAGSPGVFIPDGRAGTDCSIVDNQNGTKTITCGSSTAVVYDGINGQDGEDGDSCSISDTTNGAEITCGGSNPVVIRDGEKGEKGDRGPRGRRGRQGPAGQDATPGPVGISEVIDPCGDGNGPDEVLLKLNNGTVLVYFEDGGRRFLSILQPGSYQTTDRQRCRFSIDASGNITYQ